ncbi:uncharacterized protein TNCV_2558541 [Trichonephila clavipes]|nr:uncharacterized protein TNCV_2558541 [Trichonephila clavipes]
MPVVSRNFEHYAGDSTIFLSSTPQRKKTLGVVRGFPPLPPPPTSGEDLRLDGYLEYTHAAKALYTYRHPRLLWDSNPVPTTPQSVSLTTISDGRHGNHVESKCESDILASHKLTQGLGDLEPLASGEGDN